MAGKAKTPAEVAATPASELMCGCCDQGLGLDDGDDPVGLFCHGCKKYICDRDTCNSSPPFGPHQPWKHKPCDSCGESVNDPGADMCENCL